MAINFPSSPTDGQVYTDPDSGVQYIYNTAYGVWRSNKEAVVDLAVANNGTLRATASQMNFIEQVPVTVSIVDDTVGNRSNVTIIVDQTTPIAAFAKANTACTQSDTAGTQANAAYGRANTAYNHANVAYSTANIANVTANNTNITAVGAFAKANAALANTAGVSFAGTIYFPVGNTIIGRTTDSTAGATVRLDVAGGINAATMIATGSMNAAAFNNTSDANLKTDIHVILNAIYKTKQLNGVTFKWKDTGADSAGVIAQEVLKVLPESVSYDSRGLNINTNGLIGLLIEAIKELVERTSENEKTITELKSRIERIENLNGIYTE